MITVRMLRATNGGVPVRPLAVGEVLSLVDEEARRFIGGGRAEPVVEGPDDAAPVPVHRDPAPERRRQRGAR